METTGNAMPDPADLRNQATDTQQAQPTSPVNEGDGHEENQEPSKSLETTPPQSEDTSGSDGQLAKDDLAKKREDGKLQQVQKELDDLKKERDAEKERLETAQKDRQRLSYIEKKLTESPEKFEKALVDLNGFDPQSAKTYVDNLKNQGYWNQNSQNQQPSALQPNTQPTTGQQTPQQQVDPYEAARRVVMEEQENERTRKGFFERVKELAPENVPPEKREAIGNFTKAIEYEAMRRMTLDPKLDKVDTLVEVYKDYTGKTDEDIKAAREEGRMQGYLEANSGAPGSQKTPKGITPKETGHGLSPDELKQAELEGLSAEDFAKLKNNPVSEVE